MRFVGVRRWVTVPDVRSSFADLRITRDHGGEVEKYKAKYKRIRDSGERVDH